MEYKSVEERNETMRETRNCVKVAGSVETGPIGAEVLFEGTGRSDLERQKLV